MSVAYFDSSVILRLVIGEPGRLDDWARFSRRVHSVLVEVECLRSLDRLQMWRRLPPEIIPERRQAVFRILEASQPLQVTPEILRRASESFPAPLGTLDAIHLATALTYRTVTGEDLVFATHDGGLADAARSMNFKVVGL